MEVFENEDIMTRSDLKIPFRLELLNHLRNDSNNLTLQDKLALTEERKNRQWQVELSPF